ncbi:hypothetical protein TUM17577_14920 [Enterobacter asburiae]|nr:hypothetical protein TUM17577_14920 [Enterobacter asburiae]
MAAFRRDEEKKIPTSRIGSQTFAWTVRIAPIFLTSYAIAWGFKP